MARKKRELTRMPLKKGLSPKWRKMYKGQIYYFRGTYEEALTAWQKKRLELDRKEQEDSPDYHRGLLEKMRRWHVANGQAEDAARIAEELDLDEQYAKQRWRGISDAGRALWLDRFRLMEQQAATPNTIHHAVETFLLRQSVKVQSGVISAGY